MSRIASLVTSTPVLLASNVVLPTFIAFLNPQWSLPPYVPRQVNHDNDLFPLLFAPWSAPQDLPSTASRVLQVAVLVQLPLSLPTFLQDSYSLWIAIALARALEGWVLSRAVGWAAPRFFKHWALYEPSSGFGPILLAGAMLQITDTSKILPQGQDPPGLVARLRSRKYGDLPSTLAFGAILCWLENSPWTYGVALLLSLTLILVHRVLGHIFPQLVARGTQNARARFDTEMALLGEPATYEHPSSSVLSFRRVFVIGIASLSLMQLPYTLLPRLFPGPSTPLPNGPSPPNPLLEILMLTYPRSNSNAGTAIMQATIESYLPLLSDNLHFSVFTHAKDHPAFNTARKFFSPNVTFYADTDSHPDSVNGHYLHLAEAFRWASEPRSNNSQAEWVMLIEDDFPICAGEVGKNALRHTLSLLEASRPPPDQDQPHPHPRRRGGFIGTGGSGLIIHKTMLPVLQVVLKIHAERQSKLPAGLPRRPPDLVVQDCLAGKDPLCPTVQGDVCPDQHSKLSSCGLIITSRLVMDHIGGMYSTTWGKAKNRDKWRCGWRHPFHGTKGMEVIVVDW